MTQHSQLPALCHWYILSAHDQILSVTTPPTLLSLCFGKRSGQVAGQEGRPEAASTPQAEKLRLVLGV